VILHIVTAGTTAPIKIGANQQAPTIYLPSHLLESKPCESNYAAHPDQATIDQMITLLAAQRWYRRLARFTGIDPARQQMELALRLARGSAAEQLVQIWMQELQSSMNMVGFIEGVLNRTQGLIGSGKKFAGRLAAGSAIIWYHRHAPNKLWAMTFADLWSMINELAATDLPVPTRLFVIELIGNWVLPLSHIESGKDRYEQWYNLPRGWLYGRVRAFMPKVDRPAPKLFGEQQGLLEWLGSLCDVNSCTACPFVNSQV